MIPSGDAIYRLAVRVARIKCEKKNLQFSIEPEHSEIQRRLIKDFAFHASKILCGSFGKHRDWSFCKDAQANCRLHTVILYICCDPAEFNVKENSDYGYSLIANETKTCSVDHCSFFLQTAKTVVVFSRYNKTQVLPLCEVYMTICSPSTGNIALEQYYLSRVNNCFII